MQIMMIDNDGGGFADHIEVAEGTTVSALFAEKMPGRMAVAPEVVPAHLAETEVVSEVVQLHLRHRNCFRR